TGVARLSAGRIADLCSVDLVRGDDVHRVAVSHVDPETERGFAAMAKDYTPPPGRDHPVLRVARTRQAELHADISDEMYRQAARDEKHFNLLCSLGVKSMIVVTLVAHGEGLGTMTLARTTHQIHYTAADVEIAQEC